MGTPIIKVTNLNKYFGRLQVLKGINLEVQPREVVCVIGRSGSGKSTMLRCINFLEEPSEGEIEIHGLKIPAGGKGREHQKLVHEARLLTGMVFQEFNLFPHMSILENVMEAPVIVKGMDHAKAREIAEMNLSRVGMSVQKG